MCLPQPASQSLSREGKSKLGRARYRATYPSSIVTEFMMMQLVILTLSFMVHELPIVERLMNVSSPTWVDEPMMLSKPT